jgi:hypothetical protein
MSVFLHAVLPILGRVVAGLVGCLAFYFAIFVFKDERDKWQNRLDAVWVAIDDRAKHTDTVFTAAVNKVATGTVRVFNRVFGEKTISLKLAAVSLNSSIIALLAVLIGLFMRPDWRPIINVLYTSQEFTAYSSIYVVSSSVSLYLAIRSDRKYVHGLCLIPWIVESSSFEEWGKLGTLPYFPIIIILALLSQALSFFIDLLILMAIRKAFAKLRSALSIGSVIRTSLLLFTLAIGFSIVPIVASMSDTVRLNWAPFGAMMAEVGVFDVNTLIYCLVPALVLFALILHRLLWPLLPRFTYPLLDNKVLSERKFLIPIGTVALSIAAFGYTTIAELVTKWLKM